MREKFSLWTIVIILFFISKAYAQTTVTLESGSNGEDASVQTDFPSTNKGNGSNFLSATWTCGGNLCLDRSLVQFDLSAVPTGAVLVTAYLSLYADNNSVLGYNGTPTYGSNNAAWLRRVTSTWQENTVTWNNQPTTTTINQITLSQSTSTSQDYLNIDVTKLIQDMLANGNNGFMLMQKNEINYYNSLIFCSGEHPNSSKHPKLVITYIDCSSSAGVISALRDTICAGTPASLTLTGGINTLQWQSSTTAADFTNITGASGTNFIDIPSQTTFYRVVAGSGSCIDTSAAYKIVVKPSPQTDFTCSSSGLRAVFTLTGYSGDITVYHWDFGDSSSSVRANPNHTYDSPGSYYVCVTVYNGSNCSYTVCRDISVYPVGIKPVLLQRYWNIYPNPFNKSLFIKIENDNERIENIQVYDLPGRMVYNESFKEFESYNGFKEIELSDLLPGIYYLKIKTTIANYFQPVIKY